MTRWISGIIIGMSVILLLLYVPKEGVQGFVVLLSMLGLAEYFKLTLKGIPRLVFWPGLLMGGAVTAFLVFGSQTSEYILILFSGILILTFFLHFFGDSDFQERIKKMVFFYFGIMYVSLLFAYLGLVRSLDNWQFWVFLMIVCAVMSDTGGYILGRQIGRHKLASRLSPGKTIEGFFGGWIFSVAAAFVVRFLFWKTYPIDSLIIISSLIAFIAPLGDLSESLIKRGVQVKDSGNLIPGHGGILDRVDSLLFVGPVVYYFAKYLS